MSLKYELSIMSYDYGLRKRKWTRCRLAYKFTFNFI